MPEITYIQPSSGSIKGGNTIYIYGNYFPINNKKVKIKFQSDTNIKYSFGILENENRIKCNTPSFNNECTTIVEAFLDGYYTNSLHLYYYYVLKFILRMIYMLIKLFHILFLIHMIKILQYI